MNDKDKEAFVDFICQHDQGILQAGDESELDMAERVWQAACEYKDKEIKFYKATCATLSLRIDRLIENDDRLQAENKKLREALIECPILGEIHRDSNERFKEWNLIHRNTLRELKAGE